MRKTVPFVLIFGALTLAGAGSLDIDILARGSTGLGVAWQGSLDPGLQAAFGAGLTAQAMAACGLGGGVTLAWDYALPSPVRDLVSYRGYMGVRLALFGAWRQPERASRPLSLGVRAGIVGSYFAYTNTQLYSVAPGLFVEPTLGLRFSRVPLLALEVAVPVIWSYRADLRLAGEVGLAVEAGVRIPLGKSARGSTGGGTNG